MPSEYDLLPRVDIHGTWVRSLKTDMFGRLAYRVLNRLEPGSVEFLVLWQPDADLGTRQMTSSYHSLEDLEVRPYKPRPWFAGPTVEEVVYGIN